MPIKIKKRSSFVHDLLNQMKDNVAQFSKNVARFSEPIAGERSRLGEPNDNDSLSFCETDQDSGFALRLVCIPVSINFKIGELWFLVACPELLHQQQPSRTKR